MNQQYNYDPFEKMLKYAGNRDVLDRFAESSARLNVEADVQMVGHYDQLIKHLETKLLQEAKLHDPTKLVTVGSSRRELEKAI